MAVRLYMLTGCVKNVHCRAFSSALRQDDQHLIFCDGVFDLHENNCYKNNYIYMFNEVPDK